MSLGNLQTECDLALALSYFLSHSSIVRLLGLDLFLNFFLLGVPAEVGIAHGLEGDGGLLSGLLLLGCVEIKEAVFHFDIEVVRGVGLLGRLSVYLGYNYYSSYLRIFYYFRY